MRSKNANKQKLDTSNNSRLNTGNNNINSTTNNNNNGSANINSEFIDKESQSRRLNDILEKIDMEIKAMKQGKAPMQLKKVSSNKEDNIDALLKRTYYLTELMVFVRWTIKVREVYQADKSFDDVIAQIDLLVDGNDCFLIQSLENKIRHILNKK
jgi:hypothetical protein